MAYDKLSNGLAVDSELHNFVDELLIDLSYDVADFWRGFAFIIKEFAPRNAELLAKRESLQKQIDEFHKSGDVFAVQEYENFLRSIGYIVDEGSDFEIGTDRVDDEIALISGSQLVVPLKNERFAINACNGRWGSLYDALYGSDVISESPPTQTMAGYNAERGRAVIEWACDFLDEIVPLTTLSYRDIARLFIQEGRLVGEDSEGRQGELKDGELLLGSRGGDVFILRHNRLHIELHLDGDNSQHVIKDVIMESAISTIMDAEDSVAAVDAEDKCAVYRNWLGLMRGDISAEFTKGGKIMKRRMHGDREYTSLTGEAMTLHGRSLMLVRHVGHLMTSDAILCDGDAIGEGIMDAVITGLIAWYDIYGKGLLRNSRCGSMYVVKPKMHGAEEALFTDDLFNAVEDLLGYERYTIKVGVMDEERRTSINLKETIRSVKNRLIFINTGFLDRTGDEIHTSMYAGAMVPKASMKQSAWLQAYEDNNVAVGLRCGLRGRAQIGKGMWAMPDMMGAMLSEKLSHVLAGASCAWVPSPTAATLHATHYHRVFVPDIQAELVGSLQASYLLDLLTIPLRGSEDWDEDFVLGELDSSTQSILGYVVHWVEHGVGCSKVLDIRDIGLMEDRATLRISSQLLANWLLWGVCSREQVEDSLRSQTRVVDEQNCDIVGYVAMGNRVDDSLAYCAARDLIFDGVHQPSGYTEPILHSYRLRFKARD